MRFQKSVWHLSLILLVMVFATISCSLFNGLGRTSASNPTPTPTEIDGAFVASESTQTNPCEGLAGTLELQLLVGPSEAVGLEPYTFAMIPFQVVKEGNAYLITAAGPVDYYEDVLTADWGSFSVQFEGETTVEGECITTGENGSLQVIVKMAGQQTVVIVIEGVETTYPWTGAPQIEVNLPVTDGAEVTGEGWLLTLHLD